MAELIISTVHISLGERESFSLVWKCDYGNHSNRAAVSGDVGHDWAQLRRPSPWGSGGERPLGPTPNQYPGGTDRCPPKIDTHLEPLNVAFNGNKVVADVIS